MKSQGVKIWLKDEVGMRIGAVGLLSELILALIEGPGLYFDNLF